MSQENTALEHDDGPMFAVRLIDRRTGEVPRVNGNPLSLLTRSPRRAVAELLRGRSGAHWQTQVEPLEQAPRPRRPR
ncbi:hypothetical protein [Paracoccus yeei]|uniref:Uncharacterized protein n=1 Tax=Paracoccus yeei TaxID=147645 RepID=A0A2D2C5H4_9RHOB|nr:hypothetical protein [Paracoccus yeei]ATQ57754.1 hypothetical protein PYTT13_17900 [Paracoccus yeei]